MTVLSMVNFLRASKKYATLAVVLKSETFQERVVNEILI